jgi:hypothetical protein
MLPFSQISWILRRDMLAILTFSALLFFLISAFFVNFSKRLIKPKSSWHDPIKFFFVVIYSGNLTGFILAGYLILNNEFEIVVNQWIIQFTMVLLVLGLSTPYIYFSHQLYHKFKIPISRVRIFLIMLNIYPSYAIYTFYLQ